MSKSLPIFATETDLLSVLEEIVFLSTSRQLLTRLYFGPAVSSMTGR
jgi:hypothetical protein